MAIDRDKISAFASQKGFLGFESADFDAYEPKKWSSNAYTLARRTAKDKVLSVATTVQSELASQLEGLELFGSDEAPTIANGRKVEAQWAFFIRTSQDRNILKPRLQKTDLGAASLFDIALQSQHISVSIKLGYEGVTIGVDIPSKANVDRENFKLALEDDSFKEDFLAALHLLPGGSVIGFEGERIDCLSVDSDQLSSFSEFLVSTETPFSIQNNIEVDEAIEVKEALSFSIADAVEKLIPLYRKIAWSPEHDRIQLQKEIKKVEKTKEKEHVASFQVGERVTIMSGLFSGRVGYLHEINDSGKAKVMVGPIAVNVDAKDLRGN